MNLKHKKMMVIGSAAIATAISFAQIKLPSSDSAEFRYQKYKDHIEMSFSLSVKPEIVINKKDVPGELYGKYEESLNCFASHYYPGQKYSSYKEFSDRWFYERSQDLEKAASCAEKIPGKTLRARLLKDNHGVKSNIDSMKDLRSQWIAAYGLFMLSLLTIWWHLNDKIAENTKAVYEFLKTGKKAPAIDTRMDWKQSIFCLTSTIYLAWTDIMRALGVSAFDTSMPFFWPTIACLAFSVISFAGVFFGDDRKNDKKESTDAIVKSENPETKLKMADIDGKGG